MRALIPLVFLASCVKTNAFQCDGDSSRCSGTGARCEADGFCSIPSSTCASGFQYSDTAGELSNTCVGGGDPMPDGPQPDGDSQPPDGPGAGCEADYATITDGNPNHKYKLVTTTDDWLAQQDSCVAHGSYLAIPDDAAELAAVFALAGNAAIWVGISDRLTEDNYREVLTNTTYTALPIDDSGGNQQGQDCVGTTNGTTLPTDDCNVARVVVCECNE